MRIPFSTVFVGLAQASKAPVKFAAGFASQWVKKMVVISISFLRINDQAQFVENVSNSS